MKTFLLIACTLLLAACQASPIIEQDHFYFGQVIKSDASLQWQDCTTGITRPVSGVKKASTGPMSVTAKSGINVNSELRVTNIIGEESQGNCTEHVHASLTNTLWQLVHWPNEASLKQGELQFLLRADNTLQGRWQCHEFTGDAYLSEEKISWPVITWSEKNCHKKAGKLGTLPTSFQGLWRPAIYGDTLVLTSPSGDKAYFRALYLY